MKRSYNLLVFKSPQQITDASIIIKAQDVSVFTIEMQGFYNDKARMELSLRDMVHLCYLINQAIEDLENEA